ncbi:MAG: RDD family protein [Spirochaetes bacterium]|jgi:uncharacterized RDD family membrane protein YckC|nr:RDD family protein [Spirochaetota bacterium]
MSSITITTAHNVRIVHKTAPVASRILAFLLDTIIILSVAFILAIIVSLTYALSDESFDISSPQNIALIFFISLPLLLYYLLCEIGMNGQTIGKSVMKIRVISSDGSPLSVGQCLIRWVLRLIDIHLFTGLPAICMIALRGSGQRIGDIAAKTSVVVDNKSKPPLIPEAGYSPKILKEAVLTTRETEVIQKILAYQNAGGNVQMSEENAEKLRKYLIEKYSLETDDKGLAFLRILLKDQISFSASHQ